MPTLYENLSTRMAKRGLDKRFPGAALVMQRAATACNDIRAKREAIRIDENLSSTGKRGALLEHLAAVAPDLQKHRRAIEAARAAQIASASGCDRSSLKLMPRS
jgi:hypothetical protein